MTRTGVERTFDGTGVCSKFRWIGTSGTFTVKVPQLSEWRPPDNGAQGTGLVAGGDLLARLDVHHRQQTEGVVPGGVAGVGDAVVVGDAEDGIQPVPHGHARAAVTGHTVGLEQTKTSPDQLLLVVPVCQELDDLLLGVVHHDHLLVVHQWL